ncbi:MAG: hypothetical protein N2B03_04530 [Boseongicola sp.]
MLHDVRRLTGANFLMAETGAAAEATIDVSVKSFAMALWRREARALLDAVGWKEERIAVRAFDGGATLQISAPMDALYAATEIVEASWDAAEALLNGKDAPDRGVEAARLRDSIAAERNPAMVAIAAAAEANGFTFLGHDGAVSVGLGHGVQVLDENDIPAINDFPWDVVKVVPGAIVDRGDVVFIEHLYAKTEPD